MTRSLASRAGAWSARHRRRAILGWLLFVVLAAVGGGLAGTRTIKHDGVGESGRVAAFMRAHLPDDSSEEILVSGTAGQVRSAVPSVARQVGQVAGVSGVQAPAAVTRDGSAALVTLRLASHADVEPVLAATASAQRAHANLRIEEFGDESASRALDHALSSDFARAEMLSVPVTLLILLVAFGSVIAAGLPMLLGLTAVGATLGLVSLVSQLVPMDSSIDSVVLLIGLAVGVDYSLFYLRREREERAAGAGAEAALAAAAATSGRAILVSGLTVMVAMAGMFFAGSSVFTSFAIGTIIVVAVAVAGSLTVLPAMLSWLGPRVEKGRLPLIGRRRRTDSRVWGALVDRVLRRPGLATVLSAGALVALAIPVLGMHTSLPGDGALPRSIPIVRTLDRIQHAFPGGPAPAEVGVLAADVRTPLLAARIAAVRAGARGIHGLGAAEPLRVSADHRVAVLSIPLGRNAALTPLRSLVHREFAGLAEVDAGVTGDAAGSADFNATMDAHLPIVFGFVLGMAFLLLLGTFRSWRIAAQAIVLNLLSVGAAYGLLVLVFQHGVGAGLIGAQRGPITAWLPLFLFVVLFGLSMDYHVFILSRVREAVARGVPAREAIAGGLRSTAGVVTSAAIVMIGVFSVFGTLRLYEFKQMGVGLAAAILIDATVIRGVLLPATLALLGDRAWPGLGSVRRLSAWHPPHANHGHDRSPSPSPSPVRLGPSASA